MARSKAWTRLLAFSTFVSITMGQSMPTSNVLTRMTMLESRFGRGTTFSIDVDQREYWITAKHILTGAKHGPFGSITKRTELLSLLDPGGEGEHWVLINFSVIDAGRDVSIETTRLAGNLVTGTHLIRGSTISHL
jgi:hypothetical protein